MAFKLVSVKEVREGFPFLLELEGFDLYDDWLDEDWLIIAETDVEVEGYLQLDIFEEQGRLDIFKTLNLKKSDDNRIQGIVILGDLKVSGCMINAEGDYGPFVYVQGNVLCQSVLLGGAYVEVRGDLTAEEVVMTDYNHGFLNVVGDVHAPIFIIEDHHTQFGGRENLLFYYNSRTVDDHPEENDCYEDEETGEWLCSPVLTQYLENYLTADFEELKRDLSQGERVLFEGVIPAVSELNRIEKGYDYWTAKVSRHFRDLKRVPDYLIDGEMCWLALNSSYAALDFVPPQYVTYDLCLALIKKNGYALGVIPEELITLELCELAAKKGTSLVNIPQRFLSENLILSVMAHAKFEPNILDVSEVFVTKSLLVAYVKLGKGLYLDKICKKVQLSKQDILFKVVDDSVDWLPTIFSYHCSTALIAYAKERYANGAEATVLNKYLEDFKEKLQRYIN